MSNNTEQKNVIKNGMTYDEYMQKFKTNIENFDENVADQKEKNYHEFRKLNLHRTARISKTYEISPAMLEVLDKIDSAQNWLILTEDWCGDSAQVLPIVEKFATYSSKIKLNILERDANPDVMDLYLTNGARSIPVIVGFDDDGNKLFQWGPRPFEAQELVRMSKEAGIDKADYTKQLQLWYAKNKGKAIETDFKEILEKL